MGILQRKTLCKNKTFFFVDTHNSDNNCYGRIQRTGHAYDLYEYVITLAPE
jgi:hypothetical protein